jgi:DUF1680 family protein
MTSASVLFLAAAGLGAPGTLALEPCREASFTFGGEMGRRIERNIEAWLLAAPAANPGMLGMFRLRDRKPKPELVDWAGEFAGKYLISAVTALRVGARPGLREHVARFVDDLLATQADDGYLGPFPREERLLGHWDLWGHYHVMQGLLLWSEAAGDERALRAAERAADLICRTYLDGSRRVLDAGSHEMNMAVIHVLGMLHRRTGVERYLRMMREIEKDWERSGDYFRKGLEGVPFFKTPLPRWESLHDIQGLVELHRITGEARYRDAFVNLWRSIARHDRHNTGGFSSGEKAIGHPYSPDAIETCCTIAWMAITIDMLRLTGEAGAADELEIATWNGMLGSQHPSGRWWTYSTPMDGARLASAHSIVFQARAGTPELNCCSVNGPRGLGMLGEWAVLADSEGPVVSWLGPFEASLVLPDGLRLRLVAETGYPAEPGPIRITVHPASEAELTLRLRIPAWSRGARARVNGEALPDPSPGTFLAIRRRWRDGDRVSLDIDRSLWIWAGDREQAGKVSVYRGPILLAYDQRWNPFDEDAVPALDAAALPGRMVEPAPAPAGPFPPIILVDLPAAGGATVRLSDFATAGALGTRYRSWLPAVNLPPAGSILSGAPGQGR